MWTLVEGVRGGIAPKVTGASGFQYAGSSTVPLIFRWLDLGEVECVAWRYEIESHKENSQFPLSFALLANWEIGHFDEITAELKTTTFVGVRTTNLIQRQTETTNRSRVASGVAMLKLIYRIPQNTFAFCSVRDFRDQCHVHSFSCIDCFLFQLPVDSLRALDDCFQSLLVVVVSIVHLVVWWIQLKSHNKNQSIHPSIHLFPQQSAAS